jgi:hypothetical protein
MLVYVLYLELCWMIPRQFSLFFRSPYVWGGINIAFTKFMVGVPLAKLDLKSIEIDIGNSFLHYYIAPCSHQPLFWNFVVFLSLRSLHLAFLRSLSMACFMGMFCKTCYFCPPDFEKSWFKYIRSIQFHLPCGCA